MIVNIADTGIDIPAKYNATLFNKLSNARRKGLHDEHSTGLGMPIIKTMLNGTAVRCGLKVKKF